MAQILTTTYKTLRTFSKRLSKNISLRQRYHTFIFHRFFIKQSGETKTKLNFTNSTLNVVNQR